LRYGPLAQCLERERSLSRRDEGFWVRAERSTYFVFFPALLVDKLAHARFQSGTALPMALALMASIISLQTVLSAGTLPLMLELLG
jgi:hypothetical protein